MKLKTRKKWTGLAFALPFLMGFAGFYLIPFLWSIRYTFTEHGFPAGRLEYLPFYCHWGAAADAGFLCTGAAAV